MDNEELKSMLRQLLKLEDDLQYFFLTSRERREFQAFVEGLIEKGEEE